jgi:hypothetical protein
MNPKLAKLVIDKMTQRTPLAIEMIRRSFLSDSAKEKYIDILIQREKLLRRM